MKIEETFEIEIEGAKFVFEVPYGNEDLSAMSGSERIQYIFNKKLISVSGITKSNGEEVPLSKVKELALPLSVVKKIVTTWAAKINHMLGVKAEEEEKKDSAPESSNALDGFGSKTPV